MGLIEGTWDDQRAPCASQWYISAALQQPRGGHSGGLASVAFERGRRISEGNEDYTPKMTKKN